ncbi:MAG: adenosylcobinamide-phosphate synthase CbiB [Propionibacteriaceae bacterium]|nr:adenosylcobinamide-phosphate synthase CbiB [Propionibacteriaceae bacterium]
MTWDGLADCLAASTAALAVGGLLDLWWGDPRRGPHLVVGLGRLIGALDRRWRRPGLTPLQARRRGRALVGSVCAVAGLGSAGLLTVCYLLSPALGGVVEALLVWQVLSCKSLRDHALAVQTALTSGDLAQARHAVGQIVGRDTDRLDAAGVARAGVESVAESTTDGVVAPLFYLALGGAPLAWTHKAVNTMDSMIGHRDQRYIDFGRAAARLDDAAGWLPARWAARLMIRAAGLIGLDSAQAARVWRRDANLPDSPNAGQTEAVCAGALGLALGGPAWYGGRWEDKPTLGQADRAIEATDLSRACRLSLTTAGLAGLAGLVWRALLWGALHALA